MNKAYTSKKIKYAMDVELLRPGTVPISPDTILWFEFLLDPDLLKRHLSKSSPDPSPVDLINEFSLVAPVLDAAKPVDVETLTTLSPQSTEDKFTKKQLALKILSLKIFAHLKWNLDIVENNLPPQTQAQLVHDLLYMATDCEITRLPPQDLPEKFENEWHVKFALILLYRWYLRFAVNAALLAKPNKTPFVHVPGMPPDNGYSHLNPHLDKLLQRAESLRPQALIYLTDICEDDINEEGRPRETYLLKVLDMEVFKHLTEDCVSVSHDWTTGDTFMSSQELLMQINYDLTYNYFFNGQYDLARKHILKCKKHMDNLEKHFEYFNTKSWGDFNYASVKKDSIFGYIKALNLSYELLNEKPSLLYQLQESTANNYANLINILHADNIERSIPFVYRVNVELDLYGASGLGLFTVSRDLQMRVTSLNVVRGVLEGEIPSAKPEFVAKLKNFGLKFLDMVFWAFAPVLNQGLAAKDLANIRNFYLHLLISQNILDVNKLDEIFGKYFGDKSDAIKAKIFQKDDLKNVKKYMQDDNLDSEMPVELVSVDWSLPDFDVKSVPELEIGYLKQRLIDAFTAEDIRMSLVNLAITNPSLPLWKVNEQWQLPIPLQSVVLSLPRGFLQDFSYIILGKARQCAEVGDFKAAVDLLLILEAETRSQLNESGTTSNIYKLCKMIGWEVLLVQIGRLLAEWPEHVATLLPSLVVKCRAVIGQHDGLAPRIQVVEWALLCLLNAREYDVISAPGNGAHLAGSHVAELCARASADLARAITQRKVNKELWELVLSTFTNASGNQSKRSNMSSSYNRSDNSSANLKTKEALHSFILKLREPFLLTLMSSLFARIFNILKDEGNFELYIEYINIWPSSINNVNNYNLNSVSELLNLVLDVALKYHPNNVAFLKLCADVNLANCNYTNALKNYLLSLSLVSDYFVQPLTKNLVEDQSIYRKMIRCCSQLNSATQAAILCQYLDEVDYTLAFKCLSEKCNLNFDAMDSYYGCIWDTTILEFLVNLHHKRGESHRKQLAIKVMGLLELNSNNNDEIQREAANSRKAKFMRALVQQYV